MKFSCFILFYVIIIFIKYYLLNLSHGHNVQLSRGDTRHHYLRNLLFVDNIHIA